MPVRFTCRLLLTRTPSGTIRVGYGPPSDVARGAELVTIADASRVVQPPEAVCE